MNSIAVCISGQIRNDDSALIQTMEALKDIDADVFLSVWKKRGTKTFDGASGPGHMARIFGHRIASVIPKNWLGRMRDVFPDSSAIFPALGDVSKEGLQKYFPDADVDIEDENMDFSFPYSDSNSLRMLYKIWRCNGIKRSREKRRGKPYDLVIRMRPDITLDFKRISKLKLKPEELITHAHRNDVPNYIQDIYWIGDSKIDNIMASAFHRAVECRDLGWKGIHLELSEYIDRQGIVTIPRSYVTGNIHHFSQFDAAFEKAVKANFVDTVKQRKMDVEFAGGEAYCALAEEALDAAYKRDSGVPVQFDYETYLARITAFSQSHRPMGIVVYLLGASQVVDDDALSFNTRLSFLKFMLTVQQKFKMDAILDSLMGSIPEAFADMQQEFLDFLIGETKPAKDTDFQVPDEWLNDPLYLNRNIEIEDDPATKILKATVLSNWILNGVDIKSSAAKIARMTEMRFDLEIGSLPDYRCAAEAYRHLKDTDNERRTLEAANQKWKNCAIKAQLGELALRNHEYETAQTYFQEAQAMPQAPMWVTDRLKKCAERL